MGLLGLLRSAVSEGHPVSECPPQSPLPQSHQHQGCLQEPLPPGALVGSILALHIPRLSNTVTLACLLHHLPWLPVALGTKAHHFQSALWPWVCLTFMRRGSSHAASWSHSSSHGSRCWCFIPFGAKPQSTVHRVRVYLSIPWARACGCAAVTRVHVVRVSPLFTSFECVFSSW